MGVGNVRGGWDGKANCNNVLVGMLGVAGMGRLIVIMCWWECEGWLGWEG